MLFRAYSVCVSGCFSSSPLNPPRVRSSTSPSSSLNMGVDVVASIPSESVQGAYDKAVIKSPSDEREYQLVHLPNGFCALLIHDPKISNNDEEEEDEEDDDESYEEEEDDNGLENGAREDYDDSASSEEGGHRHDPESTKKMVISKISLFIVWFHNQ